MYPMNTAFPFSAHVSLWAPKSPFYLNSLKNSQSNFHQKSVRISMYTRMNNSELHRLSSKAGKKSLWLDGRSKTRNMGGGGKTRVPGGTTKAVEPWPTDILGWVECLWEPDLSILRRNQLKVANRGGQKEREPALHSPNWQQEVKRGEPVISVKRTSLPKWSQLLFQLRKPQYYLAKDVYEEEKQSSVLKYFTVSKLISQQNKYCQIRTRRASVVFAGRLMQSVPGYHVRGCCGRTQVFTRHPRSSHSNDLPSISGCPPWRSTPPTFL